MRRFPLFVLTALGLALLTTASVFAWQDRFEGQPAAFRAGARAGVYFWHNDPVGLSLRTTDPRGVSHEYQGTITTDGTIVNLVPVELEADDWYSLDPSGQILSFDFHTDDQIDGLDFEIAGGTGVKLSASWEDGPLPLNRFYLGRRGVNPENNPLWVCREDNGDCLGNLP